MNVTMLVMNSVWSDPRVRRAAIASEKEGFGTVVIGINDPNYNMEKLGELPFKTLMIPVDLRACTGNVSVFKKITREYKKHRDGIKLCLQTSPDVIHANDLDALPIAYFAAKKCKACVIYDSHEIYCENIGISDNRMKRFFWKTIERFLIKRVNCVVSVSNAAAAKLAEIYKIPLPTVVTNAALPVEDALLHNKAKEKFEVLSHGKYYEGRGYETFVRAAALLKDYSEIRLVLRGFGVLEKELHRIADEKGVKDNLVFELPVLVNEMVPYAARSHVGIAITEPINVNFEYTVSNKLFEYIAAGIPVIMSDVPEHRYLNEKYKFGLILKDNTPECLTEAILKFYKDKDFYSQMESSARKMRESINWNSEAKKLFEIYRSCKDKKRGKRRIIWRRIG